MTTYMKSDDRYLKQKRIQLELLFLQYTVSVAVHRWHSDRVDGQGRGRETDKAWLRYPLPLSYIWHGGYCYKSFKERIIRLRVKN